jgi:hypothetical protein
MAKNQKPKFKQNSFSYNYLLIFFRSLMGFIRGSYLGFTIMGLLFGLLFAPLTGGLSLWLTIACTVPCALWTAQIGFMDERKQQRLAFHYQQVAKKTKKRLTQLEEAAKDFNIIDLTKYLDNKSNKREKYGDVEFKTYSDYVTAHRNRDSQRKGLTQPVLPPTPTPAKGFWAQCRDRLENLIEQSFELLGGAKDSTRVALGITALCGAVSNFDIIKAGLFATNSMIFAISVPFIIIYSVLSVVQYRMNQKRNQKNDQLKKAKKEDKDYINYLRHQIIKHRTLKKLAATADKTISSNDEQLPTPQGGNKTTISEPTETVDKIISSNDEQFPTPQGNKTTISEPAETADKIVSSDDEQSPPPQSNETTILEPKHIAPFRYKKSRILFAMLLSVVRGGYLGFSILGLFFGLLFAPLTGGFSIWVPVTCAAVCILWVARRRFAIECEEQRTAYHHQRKNVVLENKLNQLQQQALEKIVSLKEFLEKKKTKDSYNNINSYDDYLKIKEKKKQNSSIANDNSINMPLINSNNRQPKAGFFHQCWNRTTNLINQGFDFLGGLKDSARSALGVVSICGLTSALEVATVGLYALSSTLFAVFVPFILIYSALGLIQTQMRVHREKQNHTYKTERKAIKEEIRYYECRIAKYRTLENSLEKNQLAKAVLTQVVAPSPLTKPQEKRADADITPSNNTQTPYFGQTDIRYFSNT